MPAKRAAGSPLPDPFMLDENTLAWMERRYPQIDCELAIERFTAWSCEYFYANWQKCFQNWLMREADNNKLGPMLKKPKTHKELVAERGKAEGFRPPNQGESVADYEQALNNRGKQDVLQLSGMLRSIGK